MKIKKTLGNVLVLIKGKFLRVSDRGKLFLAHTRNKKVIVSYYARVNNFGDRFNIDLIRFFNAELIYTPSPAKSQMSLTGSILGNYGRDFNGYILGSGFIRENYDRKNNNWNIKFIRGPLSANQCEASKKILYADPGILASKIYPSIIKKKYVLGIVPHRRDLAFSKGLRLGENVFIISPEQAPLKVAMQIQECEFIASSSLHGLIFADSFRIPNIHIKFSEKLTGGLHKFNDYYLGMDSRPDHLRYDPKLCLEEIIDKCKLRYTDNYLLEKQSEIELIINNIINSENI